MLSWTLATLNTACLRDLQHPIAAVTGRVHTLRPSATGVSSMAVSMFCRLTAGITAAFS